jgi:hypothetical protein
MQEPRRLTVPELRARRRNARLSTGPRTREGRRRVSLNHRRLPLPRRGFGMLERLKGRPEELFRLWRDVLCIFHFMGPEMEPFLHPLAWDWWMKQHLAGRGAPQGTLRLIDGRIEHFLDRLLKAYRMINREWRYRLERELGSSGKLGMWHLRLAVETRLPDYQFLDANGTLPPVSLLQAELGELDEFLAEIGDDLEEC